MGTALYEESMSVVDLSEPYKSHCNGFSWQNEGMLLMGTRGTTGAAMRAIVVVVVICRLWYVSYNKPRDQLQTPAVRCLHCLSHVT